MSRSARGDSGLEYEAGDALGVWPSNCPELVDELIGLSGLNADALVQVAVSGDTASGRRARAALRDCAAESGCARRRSPRAAATARCAICSRRSARPISSSGCGDNNWPTCCTSFRSSSPPPELPGMLKRLQPRLYSIASSPKAHPGEVHLTVSAVRYSNGRRHRKGVSSTFLADRAGDLDVPVFVQKSAHFRPPHAGDTPTIMVGPGTGVAPFRGFLHERRARGDKGRNWLFFGEQHAASDFYYRDELEAMRDDGLLTRLDVAFSRDQPDKIYVQDRMREQGAQLWSWLEDGCAFLRMRRRQPDGERRRRGAEGNRRAARRHERRKSARLREPSGARKALCEGCLLK
jgi:sulfite reductase (NADPH) flavoprotein alpha-component